MPRGSPCAGHKPEHSATNDAQFHANVKILPLDRYTNMVYNGVVRISQEGDEMEARGRFIVKPTGDSEFSVIKIRMGQEFQKANGKWYFNVGGDFWAIQDGQGMIVRGGFSTKSIAQWDINNGRIY